MIHEAWADPLLDNPISSLNTILILGSIYLGYTGYKYQQRTSVRESLEQLDAGSFQSEHLKPLLSRFHYTPFIRHHSEVQLKSYSTSPQPGISSPRSPLQSVFGRMNRAERPHEITRSAFEAVIEFELSQLEGVADVEIDQRGILLRYHSTNAVDVRRFTEDALDHLDTITSNSREGLWDFFEEKAQNLGIEAED